MQFQVPQFIETEDKIVGPLTLKQFLYVAAGGAACFGLYFLLNTWLWFIMLVLLGGLSAAMAFVKVEGRPFPVIFAAIIRFLWAPQQYVWQPAKTEVATSKEKGAPREEGSSLEKIVAGFALKSAWRTVQTGSKAPEEPRRMSNGPERYEVFRGITGEKRAARRVDYR